MRSRRNTSRTNKSKKNTNVRPAYVPASDVSVESENKPDVPKIPVSIPSVVSVKEFAEILELPVTRVISSLMKNGVIASINEMIDADTAIIVGDELGYEITEKEEESKEVVEQIQDNPEDLVPRPPIVTVMGHVDHGKTTLLDAIRKTHVAAGESGGITQHIGAYQVAVTDPNTKKDRQITFLDTPGHEAFSAMRAHGANMTDIVILVVAADDGVKPQTVEAINHSKNANVPIIVAINKIDVPGANPDRVKQELSERELVPEEWGGKTIMVPISAKKGENINSLLEMVLLTADLKEFKANPKRPATGIVIESHMQAGIGPLATVLVTNGTLKVGDSVVIGNTFGKIRIMEDYKSRRIKEALPATPVRVAGLQSVPNFGETIVVVGSEKEARQMTQVKSAVRHHISTAEASSAISEDKKHKKSLNIILKADVQGSLEALRTSVNSLNTAGVSVNIINDDVGEILDSDINMATASSALVIGFRVGVKAHVKQLAERNNIQISIYEIIYKLLEDLYSLLTDMVEPEIVEVKIGKAKVLKIFMVDKNDTIIGVSVTSGKVTPDAEIKVFRDSEEIGQAKIKSLKIGAENVDIVEENHECGLSLETNVKFQEKDTLEFYQKEERIIS